MVNKKYNMNCPVVDCNYKVENQIGKFATHQRIFDHVYHVHPLNGVSPTGYTATCPIVKCGKEVKNFSITALNVMMREHFKTHANWVPYFLSEEYCRKEREKHTAEQNRIVKLGR